MRNSLATLATGRDGSRFAADVSRAEPVLQEAVAGRRVLVVGGAGSIGAATVRALLPLKPAALDVVDHDENAMAELVRDVRSDGLVAGTTFRCVPLDYGSPIAQRFVATAGRYDAVLHFAALKHVRSEKDLPSVLQMLETNVLKQRRLMNWIAELGGSGRYFAVSTDKAANPVNFMGASKRLMEHLLFTPGATPMRDWARTSARFANVAFSAGSLLAGWRERMEKGQPLAVPRGTRRYFVSLEEAAGICLLAAFALPESHLAVPRMTPASDLRELTLIADAFVRHAGYEPVPYVTEEDARAALARDVPAGRWPVLHTALDTAGEKDEEEFVGGGEVTVDVGHAALLGIPQRGADVSVLASVLDGMETWVARSDLRVDRRDVARAIASIVPEFSHARRAQALDDRM